MGDITQEDGVLAWIDLDWFNRFAKGTAASMGLDGAASKLNCMLQQTSLWNRVETLFCDCKIGIF